MRILLTIILLLASITGSYAAYIISCNGGITAINQTGQYPFQNMVNGVLTNQVHVFTDNDYEAQLNAVNCTHTEVPDNQVFSGNAL